MLVLAICKTCLADCGLSYSAKDFVENIRDVTISADVEPFIFKDRQLGNFFVKLNFSVEFYAYLFKSISFSIKCAGS